MKILVVSDSHYDDETLRKIAMKHPDCDFYFHLGDSQSHKENISPFVSVKGNCDFFNKEFINYISTITPFGKLYAEHIPFYQISIERLKKEGYKIYLHGHTHRKRNEVIDGIHIINPGSVAYPRDNYASYCLLNITNKKVDVIFYKINDD